MKDENCPHCGYCKHCGRSNQTVYPYVVQPFWQPYWGPYYVSPSVTTTMGQAAGLPFSGYTYQLNVGGSLPSESTSGRMQ